MDGEEKKQQGAQEPLPEKPKKFIRTFAADAEALKQGNTPDLVPYGESANNASGSAPPLLEAEATEKVPLPKEPPPDLTPQSVSELPQEPEPEPEPIPEPQPEPSPEPIPEPAIIIEPPMIAAPPPPEPEPEPAPEVGNELPVSVEPPTIEVRGPAPLPIETYSSDFSDHLRDTDASAMTVLAAQQDAPSVAPRPPSHVLANALYFGASLVLLLVGVVGAYGAYQYYERGRAPVAVTSAVSAPIFVDERAAISGTGLVLERAIAQSVATPPAEGMVRLLYTTDATSTDNNIFLAMQLPAPGELLRNLALSGGMAGVLTSNGQASPFFILPVASYADTFAGMLDWEPTLPESMRLLYPPYPSAGTTTTGTATSTVRAPQPVGTFIDEIVANHNTRVYKGASGHTVLLYGYWNQSTLIIARNSAAFTEIVNRLANSSSSS